MKRTLLVFATLVCVLFATGCEWKKVPAGNSGVKVFLLGGKKGVDSVVVGPGRYWLGINTDMFLFPLYTVTTTWSKGSGEGDESITFQTKEGLSCNADIGVSFHIDEAKVAKVFQKYRKGIDEITDLFLRNMVRDAFVSAASTKAVESVYGVGKADLILEVEKSVKDQTKEIGIIIEKIYYAGELRLPQQVVDSVNKKIEATQRAQQRENELREAEAQAKKTIAEADGTAQATLKKAEAEAKALQLKNAAITPQLVMYEATQRWNGQLPAFISGGGLTPLLNMPMPTPAPAQTAEALKP